LAITSYLRPARVVSSEAKNIAQDGVIKRKTFRRVFDIEA